MQIKEIKIYSFDELSGAAKERALKAHEEYLSQSFDAEYIMQEWCARLRSVGFSGVEVNYSGFGGQGDGACFTATALDCQLFALSLKKPELMNAAATCGFQATIKHKGRYYYAGSTEIFTTSEESSDLLEQFEAELKKYRLEVGNAIYAELESAYFGSVERENVLEDLKNSEYEFFSNGEIINPKIFE